MEKTEIKGIIESELSLVLDKKICSDISLYLLGSVTYGAHESSPDDDSMLVIHRDFSSDEINHVREAVKKNFNSLRFHSCPNSMNIFNSEWIGTVEDWELRVNKLKSSSLVKDKISLIALLDYYSVIGMEQPLFIKKINPRYDFINLFVYDFLKLFMLRINKRKTLMRFAAISHYYIEPGTKPLGNIQSKYKLISQALPINLKAINQFYKQEALSISEQIQLRTMLIYYYVIFFFKHVKGG